METAKPARTVNLTAWLVVVTTAELVVNRLGARLFFPRAVASGTRSVSAVLMSASGPFLFQLTAVLALVLFVAAFAGLIRRGELYPRATRVLAVAIALVFAACSGQAVVRGQLPPRYYLMLDTGFGFLACLTAIAFACGPAPARVKCGVSTFALPGVLYFAATMRAVYARGLQDAGPVVHAGELALLVAAAAAPLLLPPRPWRERRVRLPAAVAATLTALFVAGVALRLDLLQAMALYGLRIDMPALTSLMGWAYVVALFGWTWAAVELVADKGGMRLAGYGLILLALGGSQVGSPVELTVSLLGYLALAVGELRAVPYADRSRPRVAAADWRAFVGRLATAAGDGTNPDDAPPDAIVVDEGEMEISRIRTYRRGHPIAIRLLRRSGALAELDVSVGRHSQGQPDASVERHRRWLARSPEHRLKLARSKTGDAAFDQKFSVHGQAPLGDPELRRRLARQQGDGILTLWNGSAARYFLAHPSAPGEAPPAFAGQVADPEAVDSVVAIVDTLTELIEASLAAAS